MLPFFATVQSASMTGRQPGFLRVSELTAKGLDAPSEELRSTPTASPSSAQWCLSHPSSPGSLSTGSLSSRGSPFKVSDQVFELDVEFSQIIVSVAKEGLEVLCDQHEIPESHGFGHALRVLQHADRALLAADTIISGSRRLAIQLAALLHDADDRKYFPDGPAAVYQNARR